MALVLSADHAKALAAMPFLFSDGSRELHYGQGGHGDATIQALLSDGLAAMNGRVCVATPAGELALTRRHAVLNHLLENTANSVIQ